MQGGNDNDSHSHDRANIPCPMAEQRRRRERRRIDEQLTAAGHALRPAGGWRCWRSFPARRTMRRPRPSIGGWRRRPERVGPGDRLSSSPRPLRCGRDRRPAPRRGRDVLPPLRRAAITTTWSAPKCHRVVELTDCRLGGWLGRASAGRGLPGHGSHARGGGPLRQAAVADADRAGGRGYAERSRPPSSGITAPVR